MTLPFVDSSSGAAIDAAAKAATVSGVAGRMRMPPATNSAANPQDTSPDHA